LSLIETLETFLNGSQHSIHIVSKSKILINTNKYIENAMWVVIGYPSLVLSGYSLINNSFLDISIIIQNTGVYDNFKQIHN